MTQLKSQQVQHTNMLSIFSGNALELPYRFQPDLCFVVAFDEYKLFVKGLVNCNLKCLSFGLDVYRNALKAMDNTILKKCYYYDLSKAILNELCLAVSRDSDGTVIRHEFASPSRTLSVTDVSKELVTLPPEYIQKALVALKNDMTSAINTTKLSEHNLELWRYALYLRTTCYLPQIEEIKLED